MSKKFIADFSNAAFSDLKSGKAIFKNGFRMANGTYHPNQPIFRAINPFSATLKGAAGSAINILIIGAAEIVYEGAKSIVLESIVPSVKDKIRKKNHRSNSASHKKHTILSTQYRSIKSKDVS